MLPLTTYERNNNKNYYAQLESLHPYVALIAMRTIPNCYNINEYYSPDWAIQTIKKAKKWAHRVYMYTQSGAKRLPKERNKIFFIVSSLIFVVVLFSERSNTHIWLNGWCLFSSALSYLFDRHLKPMSHKNAVWFQINFWFFFEYLRIFNWMQYFYMESCYAYYVS